MPPQRDTTAVVVVRLAPARNVPSFQFHRGGNGIGVRRRSSSREQERERERVDFDDVTFGMHGIRAAR